MAGLRFRQADPLMWDDPTRTKFSNFPPKSKDQTYTLFDIRTNATNINPTDKNKRCAHPSWAPTKEPTVSCWRYTPTPKQDRFQDLLEAICPDFLHTNLTK